MPDDGETVSCKAGINDAVAVTLPEDTTFLQAIEIEVKIPQIIAAYRDSVAYSFYTDIAPEPEPNVIDYSGKKEYLKTLPPRLSMNVTLPLRSDYTVKTNPYTTVLPYFYGNAVKTVFIRFQLVMKGIPESFDAESFTVTIKPVYIDKGRLSLNVQYPKDAGNKPIVKPFSIFIDEKQTVLKDNAVILDTGVHYLSIVSDFYRNETRTFTIEQAQTNTIGIQFRDIAPTLQISAPEGTVIFLNENPITETGAPFIISQGEHRIRFLVGDYEAVKTIQAINGRSYTVNLTVNVDVTENQ